MAPLTISNGFPVPQAPQPRIGIIYARVSTKDQADNGFSLDTQVDAGLRWANDHGVTVPPDYIFKEDYTGMALNRPELTKIRALIQQPEVTDFIVHTQDRFSRKLAHQLLLNDEFAAARVQVNVLSMPLTDHTPETQLFSHIQAVIAEYERLKILERTRRGRRGRVQAGNPVYGRRPLGYLYIKHDEHSAYYDPERKLCRLCEKPERKACYMVYPEEAALVQRIFRMYVEEGVSRDAIAAQLTAERIPTYAATYRKMPAHVWHPSSIGAILGNTAYIGTMYEGKTQNIDGIKDPHKKTRHQRLPQNQWIPHTLPAIIDQATFDAAQALRTHNRLTNKRNRKHDYLFVNGRLRCGQCGCAMTGLMNGDGYAGYRCSRAKHLDFLAPHTRRHVQAAEIEPLGWEGVKRVLDNPAELVAILEQRQAGTSTHQAELDSERQQFLKQLAQCDKDQKRWDAAYEAEAIDAEDLKAKRAEIAFRRASAEQELQRVDNQQRLIEQAELQTAFLVDYCARARARLRLFTMEEKQRALEALDVTVTWRPGERPTFEVNIPWTIAASTPSYTGGNITFRLTA